MNRPEAMAPGERAARLLEWVLLAAILVWLSPGCSPTLPASPSPSASPAVYGPQPVDLTPSPRVTGSPTRPKGSPRATGPAGTPTATPTPVVVRLEPVVERARQFVVSLSDLPPGFAVERARSVTNEAAASEEANPADVLADYSRWGRITGFEAAYTREGPTALSGLAAVESVASVYATDEGAHASIEDFRARSERDGAAPVSMPGLGDESVAYRLEQTTRVGSATAKWTVYAIRIRLSDLLISVNGYGLVGALGFEEVLTLATTVLGQPRRSLPVPLPTRTPAPTAAAEPSSTPTPTVGSARLEVLSYRAYRSAVGGTVFVVGEAANRGTGPATRVQVAVSLLDERGGVLAAANVNAAQLAFIPPGGIYPFRVMLDRVPREWSDVRIQLQPLPPEGEEPRQAELRVEGATLVRPAQSADGYGLAGDVVNAGSTAARGVRVVGIAYDGQGRVVDVAVAGAKLDPIQSGASAPFALVWSAVLTSPPHRYEVLVDGQRE